MYNKKILLYPLVLAFVVLVSCENEEDQGNKIINKPNNVKNVVKEESSELIRHDSLKNTTIIDSLYNLASKLYVKSSGEKEAIDSAINLYKKVLSMDSIHKPTYISLITIYQSSDSLEKALDYIDLFLELNVGLDNYAFLYQKALTLYCLNKSNEGYTIMNQLWTTMQNKKLNNLKEDDIFLFLIISNVLNKEKAISQTKDYVITNLGYDKMYVSSFLNNANLKDIKPCR